MTGSYIDLRRWPRPLHYGFEPIPLLNEWERKICDAWGENEPEVGCALQGWLQDAVSADTTQRQMLIKKIGSVLLAQAIGGKFSPIFFIQDIRTLISSGVLFL